MPERALAVAVVLLGLSACAIATPFRGPGYDAKAGVTLDTDTVVVAVTHAELGDGPRDAFWEHVDRVVATLDGRPGLVGHSRRRSLLGGEAWTLTVWRDEASLVAFVESDAHQAAIAAGGPALARARFARTIVSPQRIPLSWDEALQLLEAQNAAAYGS